MLFTVMYELRDAGTGVRFHNISRGEALGPAEMLMARGAGNLWRTFLPVTRVRHTLADRQAPSG